MPFYFLHNQVLERMAFHDGLPFLSPLTLQSTAKDLGKIANYLLGLNPMEAFKPLPMGTTFHTLSLSVLH